MEGVLESRQERDRESDDVSRKNVAQSKIIFRPLGRQYLVFSSTGRTEIIFRLPARRLCPSSENFQIQGINP